MADPPAEQEVTTDEDDAAVDTAVTTPAETKTTETPPAETTPTETKTTGATPAETKPAETEATVTDDTEEEAEPASQTVADLQRQLTLKGIKFVPGESADELKGRLEAGVPFREFTNEQIGKMNAARLRALLIEAKVPFAGNASVGELRKELRDHRDELLKSDQESETAAQVDEEATADASVDEETTAAAAEQQ